MRKINKKILYIVMALATLALLIPAMAVPVSADNGTLAMYLLDPTLPNPAGPSVASPIVPDSGFNISTSIVRVVPATLDAGWTVASWDVNNYPAVNAFAHIVAGAGHMAIGGTAAAFVDVTGTVGVATIVANLVGPEGATSTISIDKKWAQIYKTVIDAPQSVPVTWVEADKSFTATANVSDTVWGLFTTKDGAPELTTPVTVPPGQKLLEGVILHWYLIDGNAASNISMAPGFFSSVNSYIAGLPPAVFTTIDGATAPPTQIVTVTGADGTNSIDLSATGEEPVDVVVVPEYPSIGNVTVTPEITKVNFWTQEMEKVPQVRWAGEKIILEKNWGTFFTTTNNTGSGNYAVKFSLENQSPGMLGMVGPNVIGPFAASNFINSTQTVWAPVGTNGVSSVMLECQDQGVVSVTATLYTLDPDGNLVIVNQHGFVVYFLKLESLSLGNVFGKRANEDSGLFVPGNPWDTSTDMVSENLTVSTDTLLRARVKGWFTSSNPSLRDPSWVDMNGNGIKDATDLALPGGRWVLPDDWPALAGLYQWQEFRLHWDIMDNPFDTVMSPSFDPPADTAPRTPAVSAPALMEGNWGVGNYYMYPPHSFVGGIKVADYPVIGPFSPGIELMTPTGWAVKPLSPAISPLPLGPDALRQMSTVVPNGVLDWWDAPMPPAKITFEINNVAALNDAGVSVGNAGFFKTAMKSDIYYVLSPSGAKFYTNPFYQEMIPAHEWIPAFINNGGYDWDSIDATYGPYPFWYIINRLDAVPPIGVPTSNQDYPTKVQVYSDNHGEAMVYVNGDWNLNALLWTTKGPDIALGTVVGNTVIQAAADYPYGRIHQPIWSNFVTKTWLWNGAVQESILSVGDYGNVVGPAGKENGTSKDKLILIWATDRDGKIDGVLGTRVDWQLDTTKGVKINNQNLIPVSQYPGNGGAMMNISTINGFLDVAPGTNISNDRFNGTSYLSQPSAAEMAVFSKLYPTLDPTAYAVAGIDLYDITGTNEFYGTKETTVGVFLNGPDFGQTLAYNLDVDFSINGSHPLDDAILAGDANLDGVVSMADVTAVERMILGLQQSVVSANANGKDGINMGDVVKIERIILGLQ